MTSPTISSTPSPAAVEGWRPGPPMLGLLAGWVALFSWSGMVARPWDFLAPTLIVGVLMALAGAWLRMIRVAPYAVAAVQVVIALLSLNVIFAAGLSRLGVIPTLDSVREVVRVISSGAATLNTYSAPVEVNPTETQALLMVCGLAVILSIDVLAMGLRRPPLIALPLLGHPQHSGEHPDRSDRGAGVRHHRPAVPAAGGDRAPRPVPRLGS